MKKHEPPKELIMELLEAVFNYNEASEDKEITISIGQGMINVYHIYNETALHVGWILRKYDQYCYYEFYSPKEVKASLRELIDRIKQMTLELTNKSSKEMP